MQEITVTFQLSDQNAYALSQLVSDTGHSWCINSREESYLLRRGFEWGLVVHRPSGAEEAEVTLFCKKLEHRDYPYIRVAQAGRKTKYRVVFEQELGPLHEFKALTAPVEKEYCVSRDKGYHEGRNTKPKRKRFQYHLSLKDYIKRIDPSTGRIDISRETLEKHLSEGLTYKEIAKLYNCHSNTVQRRVSEYRL